MSLQFLGATGTVTGSKYRLSHGDHSILIDCGLFQGYKPLRLRNWAPLPFDPATLDAVLLTHAHLDHSGYLPLLVRNGFDGPIHCTEATAALCKVLLPDSGRLQEEDAEHANRHRYSKHHPALPLYTEADALRALERFEPRPWQQTFTAAPGIEAEMLPAGHLLGSAMLRIIAGGHSFLFSGDLGRPADLLMRPPVLPPPSETLILESTYGDRRHAETDPIDELEAILTPVIARGGVAVVPSFAVGRTQTLLLCLHRLKAQGRLPADLPIYLNSPMAIDATAIYHHYRSEHRLSFEECEAMCRTAKLVNTIEQSKALNLRRGPMVIIAGSGMATGGRVIHHLQAFAPDPNNTIILTGFQAGGTRGAALLNGADVVRIHGVYVPVRAEVRSLANLSAHADYQETIDWLQRWPVAPRRVFLTHGELAAADALRRHLADAFGWDPIIPDYRDEVGLGADS